MVATSRWAALMCVGIPTPDAKHRKREAVVGTVHMLRQSYATALIQSGENANTVQTIMGTAAWRSPWTSTRTLGQALSNAGEKAAALLFAATTT